MIQPPSVDDERSDEASMVVISILFKNVGLSRYHPRCEERIIWIDARIHYPNYRVGFSSGQALEIGYFSFAKWYGLCPNSSV